MTTNTNTQEHLAAREWDRAELEAKSDLRAQSMERIKLAGLPWHKRFAHALAQAWHDLDLLDWPKSTQPWYKMPGGLRAAFSTSIPEAHPNALGYFARRRMVASDPLMIPSYDLGLPIA